MRLPSRFLAAVAVLTLAAAALLAPSVHAVPNSEREGERRAVVVIPGYGNRVTGPTSTTLETSLRSAGYTVVWANVGDMTGDITDNAHRVLKQTHDLHADGYTRVDLVGISAGGLVARTVITIGHAAGERSVTTVVAIASPLNGSDIEALGPGWECGNPTCQQLKPGSAFMRGLPPLPVGKGTVPVVSLWTQDDLVVAPPASILTGARNVHIQRACPGVQGIWTGHESLVSSSAFADLTVQALTGQVPAGSVYRCNLATS